MSPIFKTVVSLTMFALAAVPSAYSQQDLSQSGAGQASQHSHSQNAGNPGGNWEKALNTSKNISRLTSSGQLTKMPKGAPTLSNISKTTSMPQVFQSEHSANPLSRPGADSSIAVRQAEKALQSVQRVETVNVGSEE